MNVRPLVFLHILNRYHSSVQKKNFPNFSRASVVVLICCCLLLWAEEINIIPFNHVNGHWISVNREIESANKRTKQYASCTRQNTHKLRKKKFGRFRKSWMDALYVCAFVCMYGITKFTLNRRGKKFYFHSSRIKIDQRLGKVSLEYCIMYAYNTFISWCSCVSAFLYACFHFFSCFHLLFQLSLHSFSPRSDKILIIVRHKSLHLSVSKTTTETAAAVNPGYRVQNAMKK